MAKFQGKVTVTQQAAEFVSEEGFTPITGTDNMFIRNTGTGVELVAVMADSSVSVAIA